MQNLATGSKEGGVLSSFVSWLSTSNTLPSLISSQSMPEFPWLALCILRVEEAYEMETNLWRNTQLEPLRHLNIPVEQAVKVIINSCTHFLSNFLKIDNFVNFNREVYLYNRLSLILSIRFDFLPIKYSFYDTVYECYALFSKMIHVHGCGLH